MPPPHRKTPWPACAALRRLSAHRAVEGARAGPLIDRDAFEAMQRTLAAATRAEGGRALVGGERVPVREFPGGSRVRPALAEMPAQAAIVRQETSAPIPCLLASGDFAQAIAVHNGVPRGLSSRIFPNGMRGVEAFFCAAGSDCGMADVDTGPGGAEMGRASGGEEETGGDRESGSDAWEPCMRRTTSTIGCSREPPLAQGVASG